MCSVPIFVSDATSEEQQDAERDIYLQAMRVYCDLNDGSAFSETYEWPDLPALSNTREVTTNTRRLAGATKLTNHAKQLGSKTPPTTDKKTTKKEKAGNTRQLGKEGRNKKVDNFTTKAPSSKTKGKKLEKDKKARALGMKGRNKVDSFATKAPSPTRKGKKLEKDKDKKAR